MSATTAEHLALVGLSGSGKSTVAPLLVSRVGADVVVDLDRMIEARLGRTVAEIFATDGEAAFRAAETRVLAEALAGPPAVIATGGGVVLNASNRQMLGTSARVVWLRAAPELLGRRLEDTTEARPLLDGDAAFALHRLSGERSALYAQVADITVDVDGMTPSDVVQEILLRIG